MALTFLTMVGALNFTFKGIYNLALENINFFFSFPELNEATFLLYMKGAIIRVLYTIGLVFVIGVVVSLLSVFLQTRFLIAPKALKIDFSRLNPVEGLRRMFSLRSVMEFLKNILKIAFIGVIAFSFLRSEWDNFFLMPFLSLEESTKRMLYDIFQIALRCGVALLAIGVFDYFYQRWEFERSIKMTKQEVKEEYKEVEGNPEIKRRQRQIMTEIMRRRMLQEVPEATVVITNPEHIAVALKYDIDEMEAPVVVAKGAGEIAQKIKQIARENDVPIIENPPLARAIYKMSEIGDEIPMELYRAVAEVIAQVYRMKRVEV